MKERLILIPLIAMLMVIGGSLCWAKQVTSPSMYLAESTFDAKEVMAGSVIEHSFKVLNKGDSPLEITKVQTS